MSLLGKFISVREPNIKYLGLENMVRLAEVPAVADTINRQAAPALLLFCTLPLASVLMITQMRFFWPAPCWQ